MMKAKTLHMIGNAHIDPVWLWRWQEGFHEVKASFRSALDRMNEFDDFVFVASSAIFYDWVEKSDPEMFAEIQRRVTEGHWEIVGGWWIEPDCNIPSGESFVRHGLYGQRYFKEKFGVIAKTGFNIDSFGHSNTLPQILKKSGIDHYVFLRPMPHEKDLPSRLFWWQADDDSHVLAFRIPFQYNTWMPDIEDHAQCCGDEMHEPMDEFMCFYGIGNHGGGPTIANIETIHQLDADQEFPYALKCSTPGRFFQAAKIKSWPIPVVHDELQNHASGCYAVHSGIKRWNRIAENRLLAAEKWSILADWVNAQPYPGDFEHAWKQVLFNQFHDILAGTSLPEAYEDARDSFGEAIAIADRSFNYAVQSFAWNIGIPKSDDTLPIVVFNSHTWPVQQTVELESHRIPESAALVDNLGTIIPYQQVQSSSVTNRIRLSFTAQIPALGYRTYHLLLEDPRSQTPPNFPEVQTSDHTIENGIFRLEIDPKTGCVASLRDKRTNTEVFSGPAARPVVIEDTADTWGHDTFRWDDVIGTFEVVDVKLVEHGPVKSVIRVTSTFNLSTLTQDFCMYPDREQIDVHVIVDWREQLKMLKLRFPVNIEGTTGTRASAYGHIEYSDDGDEYPMQEWVDVSGMVPGKAIPYGLSLLNDGKYSLDINGSDIGLTVLRSPAYAHHIPAELKPGIQYEYIDQGIQQFTYAILPHPGSWQSAGTVCRAAELNQRPFAIFATFHPNGKLPQSDSFISVEPENVIVTVVKKAEEDDGLILRAVETSKIATHGVIILSKWERTINADFAPCQIKTFHVPRDPALPVREVNLLEWDEKLVG